MKFEANLLDKIISRGLLGRRQIGRPTKYNLVNKHGRGVLELMYQPRNKFEALIGRAIHTGLPILSYFTYRIQVERARDAGLRVGDIYHQKFFREPYITWHIYAQNFHPSTLQERIRAIHFYRKPKTLFKGFRVPDWAQSHRDGWDMDIEGTRKAWENAMHEFRSEWTPMPFSGERLDPNLINWFRIEQVGKGLSARLFYNEEPNPTWHRHGGHLDDVNKTVHSFKYGDQPHENVLGFDVSTPEGRQALDAEIQRWKEITPEIYESSGIAEHREFHQKKYVSTEPHFQRALSHYRAHVLQQHIDKAIESGNLSQNEANAARSFFDERGLPSANMIHLGHKGHFDGDESWEAFQRVLDATGLGGFQVDKTTSLPVEEQLINFIDDHLNITEKGLNKNLALIVSDDRQRAKIQSLIEEGGDASSALPKEHTKSLA